MPEIDPITGLPKELGAMDNIKKEDQKITIKIIRKKFGKKYTVIHGMNETEVDMKDIAKQLKTKFACGGTAKEGKIELQGDHKRKMKAELVKLGFNPQSIETK